MKTKETELNRRLVGLLAKYKAMYHASDEQIADRLGMSLKTYRRKNKEPKNMSVLELVGFCNMFNVPKDEIAEVLK